MAVDSSNTASLLAQLTKNAVEFNRATDSINSLIERFEDTLRNLHLGIETWILDPPLYSNKGEVDDGEGKMVGGSTDTHLGFTKRAGEWGLAVRTAVYEWSEEEGYREFLRVESEFPLRDGSRQIRIAALEQFPKLLHKLNHQVIDVIKKIEAARQVVDLC